MAKRKYVDMIEIGVSIVLYGVIVVVIDKLIFNGYFIANYLGI